jgi:sugar transferase (PEP-CTERM system associated)
MLRVFRHYIPRIAFVVIALDVSIVSAAASLAGALGSWPGGGALWPKATCLVAVVLLCLYLADLYRLERYGRRELAARLLLALLSAALITAAIGFAVPAFRFGRLAFGQTFLLLTVTLGAWRSAWVTLDPGKRLRKRVLVLGVGPDAAQIVALRTTGAQPFDVLGFLDDAPEAPERMPNGSELLGKSRDLLSLVDELRPDLVLVALADMRGSFPAEDLLECRLRGIGVEDWLTFYEKQTGKILVTNLRPSWLIFSDGFVKTQLTRALKRSVDLVLSVIGLALSLPLVALIALAIKLDSRGPVLFRQERVGQNGRIFVLNKFRSMRADAEDTSGPVWAIPGDPRITRVGKWLRRTRLDELPQFLNVLVGDMSFIGPRPERPEFVRLLQRQLPFYVGRHSLRPGITGWAQVRHQYAASVEDSLEKLKYDLYYVKNLSPLLDLLILLSSVQVILFGRGAR